MKLLRGATLALLALITAGSVSAKTDIRSCFSTAPEAVLPTLKLNTRLDMIDYYDYGSDVASKNLIDAPCRVTSISDDALTATIGDDATVSLCLLPSGKQDVVMVIYDLMTPTRDSQVSFYTTDWAPLSADKILGSTALDAWIVGKPDASTKEDIENAIPFVLYAATYEPSTKQLTLTGEFADYIPAAELRPIASALRSSLIYSWNGKRFTPIKN